MQKELKAKEKLVNTLIDMTNDGSVQWFRQNIPSTADTKRDQYKMLTDGVIWVITFVSSKLHNWIDLRKETENTGEIVSSTYGQWLDDQPLLNLWKRVAKVR